MFEITADEYDFLSKREHMHWFCANCEGSTLVSIKTDKEIAQRCADYFKVLEDRVTKMELDVSTKADIQQLALLEEVVETKADNVHLDHLKDRIAHNITLLLNVCILVLLS